MVDLVRLWLRRDEVVAVGVLGLVRVVLVDLVDIVFVVGRCIWFSFAGEVDCGFAISALVNCACIV